MVGHAEQQGDPVARPDQDSWRDLRFAIGVAREHVQRRVDAQALLDGLCRRLRCSKEAARVAALAEDGADRIAGLVDGRLVAGVEQQDCRRDQFVLGQFLATFLGGDQQRQEVVAFKA